MIRSHVIGMVVLLGLLIVNGFCEEKTPKPGRTRSKPGFSPSVSPVSPTASPESPADSPPSPKTHSPRKVPSLDEMILFQPSRQGDWAPEGVEYTDVEFTSADGTRLHAWYFAAKAPRAVILYCHGNSYNISVYANYLEFLRTRHQWSVFAFDYRGYGKSLGVPTIEGVVADGRAAREKCAELANIPTTELVIWGRSMGGAVAVQLAAEEAPRGLILECTFDSFKSVAKYHAPTLSALVPADRFASIKCMPEITCPLFQVHGTADRVVPYALGENLFQAANEPKQFYTLKNYDHNDAAPAKLYVAVDRFITGQCKVNKKR